MIKIVDATQAAESVYVTSDLIDKSPTKILVLLPDAKYEDGKFGNRLRLNVSLDGKGKKWNPNIVSAENMLNAWGKETDDWVSKKVKCEIEEKGNQRRIIATPLK